jgi:hypothetical protein
MHARADSGFYCWEAVEAYEGQGCHFIISVRKTSRLVELLKAVEWKASPHTDADGQCEFHYQPEGWAKPYRFLALRYQKKPKAPGEGEPEQYQLFEAEQYSYRVFVTDMNRELEVLVWFYNQRAGSENLIKEAKNDAGLTSHPSGRFETNRNYFQLAMLAYNLNCWLMLFNRDEDVRSEDLRHTTLATARLRFLFVAAKIWRHAGRVGVRYSDHYEEKGVFQRLMDRLRAIAPAKEGFLPVLKTALT